MNELSILHLSDLHIDESGGSYSRVLQSLLADIKEETRYVKEKNLVVVVTGDIINKGICYRDNNAAYNHAIMFFKDLYEQIKDKVCGIYIVPGNHDKVRTKSDLFMIPFYRSVHEDYNADRSIFDSTFEELYWKEHLNSYNKEYGTGYIELTKEIYKIFGLSNDSLLSKSFIENTYGVDVIEVSGKRYCFILLNTSWSCVNDLDNRNLILGRFQLDSLVRQFHNLVDVNRPDLTIVLGHHPINSLSGKEEDFLFREMISYESIDANMYLCGHTHDREVINWVNNRHSINTFVTGIGWPDSASAHVGSHTYSIYVIDNNCNAVDVYMRDTNDGGTFKPDFRIYTDDSNSKNNKLTFPIRAHKTQTYISLARGEKRSQKAFYLSNSFLNYMKQYFLSVSRIELEIGKSFEIIKTDYYENADTDTNISDETLDNIVEDDFGNTNTETELLYNYLFAQTSDNELFEEESQYYNDINRIFENNKEMSYGLLLTYLLRICQILQRHLVGEDYSEGDIVRFHFRYLADKNQLIYRSLCTSFPKEVNQDDYPVSEIKYGQLIEAAYKSEKGLIYSINEQFTDGNLKDRWTNFITIVPEFQDNEYIKKYGNTSSKKIPLITFGVTINNEKYNNMLY